MLLRHLLVAQAVLVEIGQQLALRRLEFGQQHLQDAGQFLPFQGHQRRISRRFRVLPPFLHARFETRGLSAPALGGEMLAQPAHGTMVRNAGHERFQFLNRLHPRHHFDQFLQRLDGHVLHVTGKKRLELRLRRPKRRRPQPAKRLVPRRRIAALERLEIGNIHQLEWRKGWREEPSFNSRAASSPPDPNRECPRW